VPPPTPSPGRRRPCTPTPLPAARCTQPTGHSASQPHIQHAAHRPRRAGASSELLEDRLSGASGRLAEEEKGADLHLLLRSVELMRQAGDELAQAGAELGPAAFVLGSMGEGPPLHPALVKVRVAGGRWQVAGGRWQVGGLGGMCCQEAAVCGDLLGVWMHKKMGVPNISHPTAARYCALSMLLLSSAKHSALGLGCWCSRWCNCLDPTASLVPPPLCA